MTAALYCLRADLAEEIQVNDPNEDSRLERAITDASRVIDAFCRQEPGVFAPQTKVRYFDVFGSVLVRADPLRARTPLACADTISVPPLISVSELATDFDGDGTFETVWTSPTDYLLLPYNSEVKRQIITNALSGRYVFPAGQQRIRVTGSWGITEEGQTPYPIRRVCLQLATIYYRKPTNSANSGGLGGAAASIGYTDPDIAAILWKVAGQYREQWLAV